ncbi:VCBS repeat-containing protein [Senegalia massiliensis]|uniref:VCBS repeat-containing protein n=1 Tax=Senegalia massiliensis TaxID=1720316 RepID=A0A845QYA5_9CLOT|nr:VCBS repeat-containing protein [Senegalia massiliensis]NBI07947.1 VCBS repeat-containing protein [Senegalia massiliensis]
MIISYARGDVTGDRIPDNIYLTGIKTIDSPFVQNITLVIQDGKTGMRNYVSFKSDSGYEPTITLRDFTGDGVKDILISIASGGSGGFMYYYIYSAINNIPKLLFDYNIFNETYKYKVIYKDFYKVDVINITDKIKYIIDISYKGQEYLNEIYDSNGKLKSEIEGFVNPLSGLYPIDFDLDGIYELIGYQRIAGLYNADSLGYIQTGLQWSGKKFDVFNQYVAINGANI